MKLGNVSLPAALAAGVFLVAGAAHSAPIIVEDAFSGTNGAAIGGRTPDTTNLPGGAYTARNYYGQTATIETSAGKPAPTGRLQANNLVFKSIASSGSYTKPTELLISADFMNATSFVDLGFVIADPGGADANHVGTNNGFNGVRLSSNGSLSLKTSTGSNGGAETLQLISNYDAGALGAFSTSAFYNLSYIVNTATGDISNITLANSSGASVTYDVNTSNFTDGSTNLAAFTSGGNGGTFSRIDNFTIEQVPEPGSLGLLALAGLALLPARGRRES